MPIDPDFQKNREKIGKDEGIDIWGPINSPETLGIRGTYVAVDWDLCIGCGTCDEKCPMDAITLEDNIAMINEDRCIGCGICAHHCPEGAMTLNRTGLRNVFVPPPRLTNV